VAWPLPQGFYGSLMAGPNWLTHNSGTAEGGVTDDLGGRWAFNTGWKLGGAIGYAFGNGPRLETELSYSQNGIRSVFDTDDGVPRSGHGDVNQLTLMFNGAYDIQTGTRIVPYFGAGIGTTRVNFRHAGALDEDLTDNTINAARWRLTWQAFVGADYRITSALRLGIRYSFLQTASLKNLPTFENGVQDIGGTSIGRLSNHAVMLTLQYDFGDWGKAPVVAKY
jgi:opacity protein-like surface antigen